MIFFIGGCLGVMFAAIDVLYSCANKEPRDLSVVLSGNLVTICF